LSTLSLSTTRSKETKSISRINRNSKLFKTILKAIQEKKGESIVSLDLRKIPEAVADFFIICEAGSNIQVKAIADNIEYQVKENCEEAPYRHEGMTVSHWVLVDYVNIVVHIFHSETRKFYRLEEMWSDANSMDHE
jgi:ribosome-associated protein